MELVEHVGPDGFGVIDPKWLPGFGLIPILAALRAEIDEKGLGEGPRADLRRWYWSNVFLERYSSAVESKSRKDYVEMLAYWKGDRDEPSVFAEAFKGVIGSEGYKVRESASYASCGSTAESSAYLPCEMPETGDSAKASVCKNFRTITFFRKPI